MYQRSHQAFSRGPRSQGFTLIELLIVISLIMILVSIAVPSYNKVREQGRRTVCAANLRSQAQACVAYATDHDGELPNWTVGSHPNYLQIRQRSFMIDEYTMTRDFFYCPSNQALGQQDNLWNGTFVDASAQDHPDNYSVIGYSYWGANLNIVTNDLTNADVVHTGNTNTSQSVYPFNSDRVAQNQVLWSDLNLFVNGSPAIGAGESVNHAKGSGSGISGSNVVFLDTHTEWRLDYEVELRFELTDGSDQFNYHW